MATLARQAREAQGVDTMIVTGDRDILQMVDEHISVLTSAPKINRYNHLRPCGGAGEVRSASRPVGGSKGGLGDKSDNIPA